MTEITKINIALLIDEKNCKVPTKTTSPSLQVSNCNKSKQKKLSNDRQIAKDFILVGLQVKKFVKQCFAF